MPEGSSMADTCDALERADERLAAGDQLVEHDTRAEEIRAVVARLALALLGRHVRGRAHDQAGHGKARRVDARDAEVRDLERAAVRQDQVRRLDVAMHDPAIVRVLQRLQELRHDRDDLRQLELRLAVEVFPQARAVDVFHGDVSHVGVLAVLVDRDDVGMVQPPRRARLVAKARHELVGDVGIDDVLAHGLDRDHALDVRIDRLVHDAHGAAAEHALDPVLAEVRGLRQEMASPVAARCAGASPLQ
jgi:hypothetical protein